jgi:hypothetical protein
LLAFGLRTDEPGNSPCSNTLTDLVVAKCDLKIYRKDGRSDGKEKIPGWLGANKNKILMIRNQKVILDSDLAILYGTSTKRLNEQVRRNSSRFPEDFMFRLTDAEFVSLKEDARRPRSRGSPHPSAHDARNRSLAPSQSPRDMIAYTSLWRSVGV